MKTVMLIEDTGVFFLILSIILGGTLQSVSSSRVPCYLHPSDDDCHYNQKPDSSACTTPKLEKELKHLNRSMYSLEEQLIRLGVIPPDNTCPELPAVDDGSVTYSHLNLAPGCVGTYICKEGYFLRPFNGQKDFNCTEDGIWDGNVTSAPIECVLEMDRCDQPNTIDNGIVTSTKDVLLPGDMISYTCEKGYMLSGQEKRYCLRNGNWSEEQPKCLEKKTDSVVGPQVVDSPGMIAGVSVTSVLLLLLVSAILVAVIVIVIRRWNHTTTVRTNLKVDSLTITNEDLSPSHQVMSSGYTSIGGRHDSQSSNKLRLPQT